MRKKYGRKIKEKENTRKLATPAKIKKLTA